MGRSRRTKGRAEKRTNERTKGRTKERTQERAAQRVVAVAAAPEPRVLVSREGGVATLVLNRPDRLNAFTDDMREQLDAAIARVAARASRYCGRECSYWNQPSAARA